MANFYVDDAAREAGAVAEMAAVGKEAKYGTMEATYVFLPVAVETLGVLNESSSQFFQAFGSENFTAFMRRERECHFIPTFVCFGAAFQRYLAP